MVMSRIDNSKDRNRPGNPVDRRYQHSALGVEANARSKIQNPKSKIIRGQAVVIVALLMVVLVVLVGLGIDAGNLMGKRAKLQSAVDSAALSAALTIVGGTVVTSATTAKAYQILETNGVP